MNIKRIFPTLLVSLWIFFVIGGYFFDINKISSSDSIVKNNATGYELNIRESHRSYVSAIKENFHYKGVIGPRLISPSINFLIIFTAIMALVIVLKRHNGEKKLLFNLPPIAYFMMVLLTIFIMHYLSVVFYTNLGIAMAPDYRFPTRVYQSLLIAIAILVPIVSFGKKILSKLLPKEELGFISTFLFSTGFGIPFFTFCLFLLGLLGKINQLFVIILLGVLLVFAHKEFLYWIREILKPKKFEFGLKSPIPFLIFIFLVFYSINLLNVVRPAPIGHDDLEAYLNTTHLIGQNGKLISNLLPYSWELFVSSGYALSRNMATAMVLSTLSGVFAFLSIFALGKNYFKKRNFSQESSNYYSILLATLFYTLPAVTFQLSSDIKLDLAAFFFATLALILFIRWKDALLTKKSFGQRRVIVMAFFLGFAFTIKVLLVIFFLILFLSVLIELLKIKLPVKKIIFLGFSALLFFMVPFLPFATKNIYMQTQTDKPWSRYILLTGPSEQKAFSFSDDEKKFQQEKKQFLENAGKYEYKRYSNNLTGLKKYILLPFLTTFNIGTQGEYVDISFIFLAVIPFILFAYREIKRRRPERMWLLNDMMIFGSLYWLVWAFFFRGVIWYGLPGFLFLLILVAEILNHFQHSKTKFLRQLLYLMVFAWFALVFIYRTSVTHERSPIDNLSLSYETKEISETEYINTKAADFMPAVNIINESVDTNKDNPPKVYAAGKYIRYFIHNNNKVLCQDNELYIYYTISHDRDSNEIVERLKKEGFDYLFVDKSRVQFVGPSKDELYFKLNEWFSILKTNENVEILMEKDNIIFVKIK